MECPHCGALMKDEQVFCENCGKERLLVPEFDAQMDATLQSTISGIADDLANTREIKPALIHSELDKQKENQIQSNKDKKIRASSLLLVIGGMFAVVILIIGILVAFVQYNNNSYDYQITKAEEMLKKQDYEQMLIYAQNASRLAENSSDAKMMIAKAYEGLGRMDFMAQMLESLLASDPAYGAAYDLLVPFEVENKEYQKIGVLLSRCPQQDVKDKYAQYLTDAPQFSQDNGNYEGVSTVSVKLLAFGNGVIYYTLNGKDPIAYGREYMTPIILEPGDYEVKAVYQNTYGVFSEVVSNTYHVEGSMSEDLYITLESGAYESPQYIDIENDNPETIVYYTMDGTNPDINSPVFTSPIPLPLGESHFTFAVYKEDTQVGDYVRADYTLDVGVEMSGAQAVNMLIQNLIGRGMLTSNDGLLPDMEGRKTYDAYTLISQGDTLYYLIFETYISPDDSKQRTGNLYAVNVLTGESYQAKQNEEGIFDLSEIK